MDRRTGEPDSPLGPRVKTPISGRYSYYRLKHGRVTARHPGMFRVDLALVHEPTYVFEFVSVMMPCLAASAVPQKGDDVLVGFIDGNMDYPVVLGLLDKTTEEESLRTAKPYFEGDPESAEDRKKLENRILVVYPHEMTTLPGPEENQYLRRASWMALDPDGHVRFVHNQLYPNPNDAAGVPAEFSRKYLVLEVDETESVGLRFPWAAGSKERTLHARADDATGDVRITVDRSANPSRDLSLIFTARQTIKLQVPTADKSTAKTVELSCDGENVVAAMGENKISIGSTIKIETSGVVLEISGGQVTLTATNLSIDAQEATLKAGSVKVESSDVRLGDGGRAVAYKGAKTKRHRHTVTVDGHRYNTSDEDVEIDEGASGVKV